MKRLCVCTCIRVLTSWWTRVTRINGEHGPRAAVLRSPEVGGRRCAGGGRGPRPLLPASALGPPRPSSRPGRSHPSHAPRLRCPRILLRWAPSLPQTAGHCGWKEGLRVRGSEALSGRGFPLDLFAWDLRGRGLEQELHPEGNLRRLSGKRRGFSGTCRSDVHFSPPQRSLAPVVPGTSFAGKEVKARGRQAGAAEWDSEPVLWDGAQTGPSLWLPAESRFLLGDHRLLRTRR